ALELGHVQRHGDARLALDQLDVVRDVVGGGLEADAAWLHALRREGEADLLQLGDEVIGRGGGHTQVIDVASADFHGRVLGVMLGPVHSFPREKTMSKLTLYGIWLSGPTYKAGLALSLMGQPFAYKHVDLRAGAHKQPEYLAINRFGQVPALVDGDLKLC